MAGQKANIGGLPTVDRVIQRYKRVQEAIVRLQAYPQDDERAQAKLVSLKEEAATLSSQVESLKAQLAELA